MTWKFLVCYTCTENGRAALGRAFITTNATQVTEELILEWEAAIRKNMADSAEQVIILTFSQIGP